jgi:hypothetical protein
MLIAQMADPARIILVEAVADIKGSAQVDQTDPRRVASAAVDESLVV